MHDDIEGWNWPRVRKEVIKSFTRDKRHAQSLCRLLVRSTCETHECDPCVGYGRTAVEYLCYADSGAGELDIAICP